LLFHSQRSTSGKIGLNSILPCAFFGCFPFAVVEVSSQSGVNRVELNGLEIQHALLYTAHMHKIDTRQHPVIIMYTIEPIMVADMQAIAENGNALLAAGQPFALVMVSDGGDSKGRERGANAMLTQWVKQNKPQLEQLCAGMASVVPTSALMAIYKPMMKTIGSRMYGFPLEMFTDIEEARHWAQNQLSKASTQA
jgi:hypothetical protein